MPLSTIIVANIRKARKARQFSQEYMALKLGMSQPAYSDLENENVRFPIERMEKFAEILECPIEELLEGIVSNRKQEHSSKEDYVWLEEINLIKQLHDEIIRSKDELIQQLKNQLSHKEGF